MRAPGLLLAGSLSFLPFVLALATGGSLAIEGAAWTALALAPWLALAGLPRAAAPAEEPRRAWLLPPALALPALGLALGADPPQELTRSVVVAAGGLGLVMFWSLAARRGAGPRARAGYGLAWLLLVPGAAAAVWALSWAPGGETGHWVGALELALPLPWLAAAAEREGEVGLGRLLVGLGGNLGVVLALCGLLQAVTRERP